jgi:hypothetical protein
VTIVLSIYSLLITALVSFKHLLLVAICVADLPTANYPFGILQTFITSGHCVVDLLTANYQFGIFKYLLLVDIVLLIYSVNYRFSIFQTCIASGHCVVDLPTTYYPFVIVETFITSGNLCCRFTHC